MEGDLRAVGAEHGVPAASDPEGVQAVRLQVTHNSAGTIHPVCSPPDPTVLTVLLGRGLARAPESGEKEDYLIFTHTYKLVHGSTQSSALHLLLFLCMFAPTCGIQARGDQ